MTGADNQLPSVLALLPQPAALLDPERDAAGRVRALRVIDANPPFCAACERRADEVIGREMREALPGTLGEGIEADCVRVAETGEALVVRDRAYQHLPAAAVHVDLTVVLAEGLVYLTYRDVTAQHETTQAARRAQTRLRAAVDSMLDPFVILNAVRDRTGTIIDFVFSDANPAACAFNNTTRDLLVGTRLLGLHPAASTTDLMKRYVRVVTTGEPLILDDWEYPQDVEGGAWRRYDVRAVKLNDGVGQSWRDVTAEHEDAERLRESERRFRMLAENTMDFVFALDNELVVTWASPATAGALGVPQDQLPGRGFETLVHGDDVSDLESAMVRVGGGENVTLRLRMRLADESFRWVEMSPRILEDSQTGVRIGLVVGIRDVHDEVTARESLKHLLDFDSMTGLARRPVALLRIDRLLHERRGRHWALVCVGIDGLRVINHAFTHAAGDIAITTVAERLAGCVGSDDRVARIAGDEFAVLMPDVEGPTDAAREAERLLEAVRGAISVAGQTVSLTCSAGIAIASDHDAAEMLRDATAARHHASSLGADRWAFLEENIGESARATLKDQAALRQALADRRLEPWLMPIVTLPDRAVVGYEALARWIGDDGSARSIGSLIPDAERSGLIRLVDLQMIRGTIEQLASMPPDGDTTVSLNVSAVTLGTQPHFAEWLADELHRTGLDGHRINLEVTETALFQLTPALMDLMRTVSYLGVSWWVDDFGTGYSSISHLRDMPLHGIKLDRTFTAAISQGDPSSRRIAEGLAALADGLHLSTIAEGVETEAVAEVLREQGWQLGQGWLFGKARPMVETLPGPS